MAMMNATEAGPQKVGMPIVDSFAGYLAVIAILAALRKRDSTGKGETIDVAMLDAALKLIATGVSVYSYTGEAPVGTGNRGYRLVATAEYYPTAEGWIALGANHQHQIAAMFRSFGHEAMIEDPRFADHKARVANYDALKAWLIDYLSGRRAEEVEAELTAAGGPGGDDPRTSARSATILTSPIAGCCRMQPFPDPTVRSRWSGRASRSKPRPDQARDRPSAGCRQ
jgi:crotonobetainyl-CoA:carnitine CoA-transferase CaiB-like acyl-CoA transferase